MPRESKVKKLYDMNKIFLCGLVFMFVGIDLIAFGENRVLLDHGLKTGVAVRGTDKNGGGCSILPFKFYLESGMIEGNVIIKGRAIKRIGKFRIVTEEERIVGTLKEYCSFLEGRTFIPSEKNNDFLI